MMDMLTNIHMFLLERTGQLLGDNNLLRDVLNEFVYNGPFSSALFRNTIFVSSITFFNVFIVFFMMFLWSLNRQTQIRKSKSQQSHQSKVVSNKQNQISNNDIETYASDAELDSDSDEDDISLSSTPSDNSESTRHSSRRSIFGKEQRRLRQEIIGVMSKMKVFSYLDTEAFLECLNHAQYIDLPNSGMPLINDEMNEVEKVPISMSERLDGSLYVVISGEITCTCDLVPKEEDRAEAHSIYSTANASRLEFAVGPGDVVTSLLSVLSGLVQQYRDRLVETQDVEHLESLPTTCPLYEQATESDRSSSGGHTVHVRASSSKEKTRLIRIPPRCFLAVLDKYPHAAHQISQTIIARTLRVTVQSLVNHLGLGGEVLCAHQCEDNEKEDTPISKDTLTLSESVTCHASNRQDSPGTVSPKDDVYNHHHAASVAAKHLGIDDIDDAIQVIQDESGIVSYLPGDIILDAGSDANYIYQVLDGELEVGMVTEIERGLKVTSQTSRVSFQADTNGETQFSVLRKAHSGELVGQMACFASDVSIVRIKAVQKTTLLQISKNVYQSLLDRYPACLMNSLDSILTRDFSPIVHYMDWGMKWLQCEAGYRLAQAGDDCESLFIVLNGRIREVGKGKDTISEYGRGRCLGGACALTGCPWPSDVYATRNSELAIIPLSILTIIMNMFPSSSLHFAKSIAQAQEDKKRDIEKRVPSSLLPSYNLSVATIAVVSLFPSSQTIPQVCSIVKKSLDKIAPCKVISKQLVRDGIGERIYYNRNALHEHKVARLLGDIEESHRLVIYEADQKLTWWTKVCISQADCVLIIAGSNDNPQTQSSKVSDYLSWAQQKKLVNTAHLVVLQQSSTQESKQRPSSESRAPVSDDLNDWSEKRPWIVRHHLVRTPIGSHRIDIDRMCRRITGVSVGLVLGGGGARGIAHLGIIKALIDSGVTVDMVGGSSQGAFIAALFAKNPDDFDVVMAQARLMACGMSSIKDKILDLTFPLVSYFNGKGFNKMIQRCVGSTYRIQDMRIPFFCITTDVVNNGQVVHTKGTCWKYVRASMSLHGYLPPITDSSGGYHLDGGYTNIVPGDVMRSEMNAGYVIAVDVSPEESDNYFQYGNHLSGFWLLVNSWNPFVKTVQVPSMGDLSSKLIWISAMKHLSTISESVDLFLSPPVGNYHTLSYEKFDEIFEIGYTYAKPRIEKWLKSSS